MLEEMQVEKNKLWPWSHFEPKTVLVYGIDLTERAAQNKLEPVIGRQKETERLIQILCRKKKNNPAVIGEPGVGKTAIVEGLAQRIVGRRVPKILANKHLIGLDLAAVLAGTKYRGEFEKRLKTIIGEVAETGNIILFIDELHIIMGTGAGEGSGLDASNILKSPLARGEIQCIGATTLDEYRKWIERDGAMERRFQPMIIEPSTPEETLEILRGRRPGYETHHQVKITDKAIGAAVALSARYISGRFLPDKALDVIDEAASRTSLEQISEPPNLTSLAEEIQSLSEEKEKAIEEKDFSRAAVIRTQLELSKDRREEIIRQYEQSQQERMGLVNEETVAKTVAVMTGIPIAKIEKNDAERLMRLEEILHQTVIGQSQAIRVIAQAIRRSRAGLKDPKRPSGSFIFVGPTGVGKTLVAKSLAEFLFGTENALIQLDMSEYLERHNASRLIGAPPGYVGYEEGGQLTEKIRRQPYAVILLDEIEKAHPDFCNLLLQILEEGRLTDSFGRTVDFRNTVIIMTSNLGARLFTDSPGLGFQPIVESRTEKVMAEIQKHFRPEFLNRVDEVVVFELFNPDELQKIVQLELAKVAQRLKKQKIAIEVTPAAEAWLIKQGYNDRTGVRGLRQIIEKQVENPLAELILTEKANAGDEVVFELTNGQISLQLAVMEEVTDSVCERG